MTEKRAPGLFVVLEGADGSGKTALTEAVVDTLRRRGHEARATQRNQPLGHGHPTYSQFIAAVVRLFRADAADNVPLDLLTLAAAAQYTAILHSQVIPAVADGDIVVADGWWDKVWIRLGIEAQRCLGLNDAERDAFWDWQQSLFPSLPGVSPLTVLVDTRVEDRIRWQMAAGCPEVVYDLHGRESTDPQVFGDFTALIAGKLSEIAVGDRWPTVRNGSDRGIPEVATDLVELIEGFLARPRDPAVVG